MSSTTTAVNKDVHMANVLSAGSGKEAWVVPNPQTEVELREAIAALKGNAALPRPPVPELIAQRVGVSTIARIYEIQHYIESFEYNHTGVRYFNIRKQVNLPRIVLMAKQIAEEALPIQCLEAVFVGIHLTASMSSVQRVPIGFKTRARGKTYEFRHIVLAVQIAGKWGAIGLSRKNTLMDKKIQFDTLADLVEDYRSAYAEIMHVIDKYYFGLPIDHDLTEREPIRWQSLSLRQVTDDLDAPVVVPPKVAAAAAAAAKAAAATVSASANTSPVAAAKEGGVAVPLEKSEGDAEVAPVAKDAAAAADATAEAKDAAKEDETKSGGEVAPRASAAAAAAAAAEKVASTEVAASAPSPTAAQRRAESRRATRRASTRPQTTNNAGVGREDLTRAWTWDETRVIVAEYGRTARQLQAQFRRKGDYECSEEIAERLLLGKKYVKTSSSSSGSGRESPSRRAQSRSSSRHSSKSLSSSSRKRPKTSMASPSYSRSSASSMRPPTTATPVAQPRGSSMTSSSSSSSSKSSESAAVSKTSGGGSSSSSGGKSSKSGAKEKQTASTPRRQQQQERDAAVQEKEKQRTQRTQKESSSKLQQQTPRASKAVLAAMQQHSHPLAKKTRMQVEPTFMQWDMTKHVEDEQGRSVRRGSSSATSHCFYFYVRNIASQKRRIALTTPSSRRFRIQLLSTGTKGVPPTSGGPGTLPPIESSSSSKSQKKKASKARLLPFGSHIVMKLPANGWCHFSVEATPPPALSYSAEISVSGSRELPPTTPKPPRQLCSDQLLLFECEDPRVDAARIALIVARCAASAAEALAGLATALAGATRAPRALQGPDRTARLSSCSEKLRVVNQRFDEGMRRVSDRRPCECFARVRLVQYAASPTARKGLVQQVIEAGTISQTQPLPARWPNAPTCPCGRGCV